MKLFYSFNFLFLCLKDGKITADDLEEGIYAFQARRVLVMFDDPRGVEVQQFLESNFDTDEERDEILALWENPLLPALRKAEEEGRAIWREGEQRSLPYERLANFLNQHGFRVPLQVPFEQRLALLYTGALRSFLEEHAPGLELVVA